MSCLTSPRYIWFHRNQELRPVLVIAHVDLTDVAEFLVRLQQFQLLNKARDGYVFHLINQVVQILEIRLIEIYADHFGLPVLPIKVLHYLMQIKKEIDASMPEVKSFLFLAPPYDISVIHPDHRLHDLEIALIFAHFLEKDRLYKCQGYFCLPLINKLHLLFLLIRYLYPLVVD